MGEDKSRNALDAFWEKLGDKEKLNVRSYRPRKRDIQTEKEHAGTDGQSGSNSRKRGD